MDRSAITQKIAYIISMLTFMFASRKVRHLVIHKSYAMFPISLIPGNWRCTDSSLVTGR